MNRLIYTIYAIVIIAVTTAVNSGVSGFGNRGGIYRSWGGPSISTGSGWSGGHK